MRDVICLTAWIEVQINLNEALNLNLNKKQIIYYGWILLWNKSNPTISVIILEEIKSTIQGRKSQNCIVI